MVNNEEDGEEEFENKALDGRELIDYLEKQIEEVDENAKSSETTETRKYFSGQSVALRLVLNRIYEKLKDE